MFTILGQLVEQLLAAILAMISAAIWISQNFKGFSLDSRLKSVT